MPKLGPLIKIRAKQGWLSWSESPWPVFAYFFFGLAILLTWTVDELSRPVPDIAERLHSLEEMSNISTAAGCSCDAELSQPKHFETPDFEIKE